MSEVHDLGRTPIHLEGVESTPKPDFDGSPEWFGRYIVEHPPPGFLVTWFSFQASWDMWEMHPNGSEVVLCVSGSMTLHQETSTGDTRVVRLTEGEYVINEPGVWHTADADVPVTGLFITAGEGTDHRPR